MFKFLKPLLLISVFIVSLANAAQARDAALSRIIGFSPDGKYFAFEQYGVGDASGLPFSEIFFIDTIKNTWVQDPIRILIKDDNITLSQARIKAVVEATPIIKRLGTTLHGFTVASNPITQEVTDRNNINFGVFPDAPSYDRYNLKLTMRNFENEKCKSYAPDTKIFNLALTSLSNQGITRNYADNSLPTSRGCALDYSISEIHFFEATNGDVVFMTFVNVMSYGWEGLDRRFMVTPFYINK
ncbi:MAG: DUF2259 domain-containing protein [Hyphomicrobiales bacterium]